MSLKSKQKRKKRIKSKGLAVFYSEMIKFFSGVGIFLYLRPKIHRISKKVPKNIKGRLLIAANHTSMLDPVALFYVFWRRRLYFPATEALFSKPINRFFFENMNCIRIERNANNTSAIRKMCALLNDERAVAIFPEGRINATAEDIEIKLGTAFMAVKCNCPILPVYISHREKRWQRIHVVIGEPIFVDAVCKGLARGDAIAAVSESLKKAEKALEGYYEEKVKGRVEK